MPFVYVVSLVTHEVLATCYTCSTVFNRHPSPNILALVVIFSIHWSPTHWLTTVIPLIAGGNFNWGWKIFSIRIVTGTVFYLCQKVKHGESYCLIVSSLPNYKCYRVPWYTIDPTMFLLFLFSLVCSEWEDKFSQFNEMRYVVLSDLYYSLA